MYCDTQAAVNDDGRLRKIVPLLCRSWSCERCQPIRRLLLIALGISGHPDTFITLTVNPATGTSPGMRAQRLRRAWVEVRRRAVREAARDPSQRPEPAGGAPEGGWPRDRAGRVRNLVTLEDGALPFLAVFEATKLGEPHLHILARARWIDQRWLSLKMAELARAPVVDVRRVADHRKAASYVAKYIGKEPERFPGCKRYWKSKDWMIELPHQEQTVMDASGWRVEFTTALQMVDRSLHDGYRIKEEQRGAWLMELLEGLEQ